MSVLPPLLIRVPPFGAIRPFPRSPMRLPVLPGLIAVYHLLEMYNLCRRKRSSAHVKRDQRGYGEGARPEPEVLAPSRPKRTRLNFKRDQG